MLSIAPRKLPKPGGYITVDLYDVLTAVEEYFADRAEGGDGYSEEPNEEMHLLSLVADALEAYWPHLEKQR